MERVYYFLVLGESDMKGVIRPISRQKKCSACNAAYVRQDKKGFVCPNDPNHKRPTRFQIEIYNTEKKKTDYVCSDKQGLPLDSYERALNLLAIINVEMERHTFDVSNYVKSELSKYYVCNLLDRFLTEKLKETAPSYEKDYKRYVRIAKKYWKIKDVRTITKQNIREYREHCLSLYTNGKSADNVFENFKTFLNYCKDEFEISNLAVPKFTKIDFDAPDIQWCHPVNQIHLFNLIDNEDDKAFVHFLALHGCRPGEARALQCKDVNLDERTIKISKTFSGKEIRNRRKSGKKNASNKEIIIPIHDEMHEYISKRVKSNLPDAYLFINPRRGKPYSMSSVRRIWERVRDKAGLTDKKLKLYGATRHSLASQLANTGASQFIISKTLGHSDIRTSQKYMHADAEAVRYVTSKISMKKPAEIIPIRKKKKHGRL